MATITATKAGNWSDPTVWSAGVPGDGDTADLNGFVVVMDIATIPSTGTLLALISPAKAGQLTVALNTLGNCTLNATTITAGTKGAGFIVVSGAAPANILTINYTTMTASTTNYGDAVQNNSTGTINIMGSGGALTGGSGIAAIGANNVGNGIINISQSNVTGGSSRSSPGANNSLPGGAVNLLNTGTGCNLIHTTGADAVVGPSVTWNALATNYIQFGSTKFAPEPAAANIKKDVQVGTVTGTLSGGVPMSRIAAGY